MQAPELEFHPLANLFPLLQGDDFQALLADVQQNGVQQAVVLYEGKILDGRNRYRACVASGRTLGRTVKFMGDADGALRLVLSANLHRRHLNESQRAMAASRAASGKFAGLSQAEAARLMNVSERSVRLAKAVLDKAGPDLVGAVDAGKVAVSLAAQLAEQPDAVQREALAHPERATGLVKLERRAQRERELGDRTMQAAATGTLYGVIYADPPWRFQVYSRDTGMDRAADNHYPTMAVSDIAALEVPAADDCVLFLWATVPMLPAALEVMAAWGFTYRSACAWVKDRPGTGYWFRNTLELLLVGTKGEIPAPAPGEQYDQVIKAAVTRHSEKPGHFCEMIEELFPTTPRIELFARAPRLGWAVWGNEVVSQPEPADAT